MMLIAALILVEVVCVSLLVLLRQWRARWHSGNVFELDVAEDAPLDMEAWRSFFRNLYGMTPPAWKRALLGVPHMTFEIWAAGGELSARCWCPDRLQGLAAVSLRTAAPGLEMSECADATQTFGPKAARARVQLWRESIHPLGERGDDALRGVLVALAEAPTAVLQVSISPDVGWQRRALGQYDQAHAQRTRGGPGSAVVGEFGSLLREICGIFLPSASGLKAGRASDALPPSSKIGLPAPDKAMRPGWRTEVRLRVEGPTTGDAKRALHALSSSLRACDGANGMRPVHVWRAQAFDDAIKERRPPG